MASAKEVLTKGKYLRKDNNVREKQIGNAHFVR